MSLLRNEERAKQLILFDGLCYGESNKLYPMDIDGFIEFNDSVYIFIEIKYRDAEMSTGQRIAYERICNALTRSGREAIVIQAVHDILDTNTPVEAQNLQVVKFFKFLKWIVPETHITVGDIIDVYYQKSIWEPTE